MAEQTFVADADLERALRDLGQYIAYPPTPDLAQVVRARLATVPRASRGAWLLAGAAWQRALAVAALVLVVLLGTALLISPAARDALAERLGLKAVTIEHVPEVATPAPTATPVPTPPAAAASRELPQAAPATLVPSPTPPPPGATLGLGRAIGLDDARGQLAFGVLVPSDLGSPDAVYVQGANQVSLVYAVRPGLAPAPQAANVGLLLTEFRATLDQQLLMGKGVPPGARLEEVRVGPNRAFWISGAPHAFFYREANGQVRDERSRLAGNTLVWEQDGLTLRIESALERGDAIRVAESLR